MKLYTTALAAVLLCLGCTMASAAFVYNGTDPMTASDNGDPNELSQHRMVIGPYGLIAAPAGANKIRVHFQYKAGTSNATLRGVYIGRRAATGNAYVFNGSQVHLLFSGGDAKTGITGAQTVVSDYADFSQFNNQAYLTIAFMKTGTQSNLGYTTSGSPNNQVAWYESSTDNSGTSNPGAMQLNDASGIFGVVKVEMIYVPSGVVNGACGSANGVPVSSAPTTNLCSAGTASTVAGTGPWTWTCNGSGGGTNASCSAPVQTASSVLKGVNLSGGENGEDNYSAVYGSDYFYPEDDGEYNYYSTAEPSGLGMKVIRLPFDQRRLQPTNGAALNAAELGRIQAEVARIKAKGMKTILDPHQYGYVWSTSANDYALIESSTTRANFNNFWTRVADAFENETEVIFGLMNEPQLDVSAASWRTSAEGAIAAIRAAEVPATRHTILIPGISWTGAHSWVSSGNAAAWATYADPVGGPWMFEMHQYLDDNSGTQTTCQSGAGSRLTAATNWARPKGYKIFLGEFSWESNSLCNTEGTALMNFLAANTDVWGGWTWWGSGPHMGDNGENLYDLDFSPPQVGPQTTILRNYLP